MLLFAVRKFSSVASLAEITQWATCMGRHKDQNEKPPLDLGKKPPWGFQARPLWQAEQPTTSHPAAVFVLVTMYSTRPPTPTKQY